MTKTQKLGMFLLFVTGWTFGAITEAAYLDLTGKYPAPAKAQVEPGPGFRAEGAECITLAVLEDGTRVYRVHGPKLLYATVVCVGPDGHATIRQ